jgi:hypothetical protein
VVACCFENVGYRYLRSLNGRARQGEVKVCRVSVVTDVDKPECGSTLEHQMASIRKLQPVKLRNDV